MTFLAHHPASSLRTHCRTAQTPRGVVLIIVLVVVVILSLGAYTFTDLMVTYNKATLLSGQQIQAGALVDSGAETVRMFLTQDEQTRFSAGGVYDNPTMFQGLLIVDDNDPLLRGRFSVISPARDDDGYTVGYRYGLENVSGRINLNTLLAIDEQRENAGRDMLMSLPGMTVDIADAILDWLDDDDEPREYGAEFDYYSSLDPAYAPQNGPLKSVEELLLVRDIFPELMFGSDVNRNATIEQGELEGGMMNVVVDDLNGSMERGWSAYLTLFSREKQRSSLDQPLIFLNSEDVELLYTDLLTVLDQELATFIVAYRQNGPYEGNDEADDPPEEGELDLSQPAQTNIENILDLIGTRVEVTFVGSDDASIIESPLVNDSAAMQQYLPLLMDSVTVIEEEVMAGRININVAPRAVLTGLPGMTEDLVEEILVTRSSFTFEPTDLNWQSATWLLSEGLLIGEEGTPDLEKMRELLPFVTAGGSAYRAQIVGYYEGGGASSRVEVVFDTSGDVPRILSWRDITHLGRGYDLETLGVDSAMALQPR